MYAYRNILPEDFAIIATFPQNKEELFFMYPKGQFPLTVDQLMDVASTRECPTVVTYEGEVVGYGNLYNVQNMQDCWLGNVIINPTARGKGAGTFLIQTMIKKAVETYGVRAVKLVCHNVNTSAMIAYHKIGFRPFDSGLMEDYKQQLIVAVRMKLDTHLDSIGG